MNRIELGEKIILISIELNALKKNLEIINLDLKYLNQIEEDLEYNLAFLKKEKVTILIDSYRLSVNQLKYIKEQRQLLVIEKRKVIEEMQKKLKVHEELFDDFFKMISEPQQEAKIIQFKGK